MMRDLIEAQRRILEHEGQLLDDEEYKAAKKRLLKI